MLEVSKKEFYRIIKDKKLDVVLNAQPIRDENDNIIAMCCYVKFRNGTLFGKSIDHLTKGGGKEEYYIADYYSFWIQEHLNNKEN